MKGKIRVESYVRCEDRLIPVEDLPPDQRERLAVWLKTAYLNELFRGQGKIISTEEKEKT